MFALPRELVPERDFMFIRAAALISAPQPAVASFIEDIQTKRWNIDSVWLQHVWRSGPFLYSSTKGAISLRLCHQEPTQYSLTFVVRCRAAGVRLEQSVFKGRACRRLPGPGVTISLPERSCGAWSVGGWRGAAGFLFNRRDRRPRWITHPENRG